jgi:type II secretory ATPase GspE/PulE/Tfp pilus assembly ATPase PilB-like protein
MKIYKEQEVPQPSIIVPQPPIIEQVLESWCCDYCKQPFELEDGRRPREDRAELRLSPRPEVNIINDQLRAELCRDCWQKVYKLLTEIGIRFEFWG